MGANQNAENIGSTYLGINKKQCVTFTPTPVGFTTLMRSLSSNVSQYRKNGYSEFSQEMKNEINNTQDSKNVNKVYNTPENSSFYLAPPPVLNRLNTMCIVNNNNNKVVKKLDFTI